MRIILLLSFFSFLFAMPNWFYNLDNDKSNYYIGYGEGQTLKEAKTNALNDISSQIKTTIKSEFQSEVSNYKKNISQNINASTKANLSDYKVLKITKNEDYFIAIGYEYIPNIDKFIKKLPKNLKISNNLFLNNSYLGKYIKLKVGQFIDFSIFNKDGNWYISYNNIIQILDKNLFEKLYFDFGNQIKTNHKYNIFRNDELVKVFVKSPFDGYVTLFDIQSDGEVYILMKNRVSKNKWNELKSKKLDLQVYTDKKEDIDMYVAIFTKNRPNFDEFTFVLNPNNNHDFGVLINILKNYKFSTLKIITKR